MKELQELLKERRLLCKNPNIIDYVSDQEQKLPQPPLVKEKMSDEAIKLPVNYEDLDINNNFLDIINNRKSSRVYTSGGMSLLELSYLFRNVWIKALPHENIIYQLKPHKSHLQTCGLFCDESEKEFLSSLLASLCS